MAKFTELPVKMQLLTVFAVLLGLSLAAWWFIYKDMKTANDSAALEVKNKQAENERLKTYEPKLQDMRRQIATYKEQLENMKKIVPDEKLADQFIELMQATAATAGIEIRRYTARNTTSREFYTEAPYEMEVDGPYYSMLGFFERVGKLERIINVSSLKVANLEEGRRRRSSSHLRLCPQRERGGHLCDNDILQQG